MTWYEQMIDKAKRFISSGQDLQPVLFLRHCGKLTIIPIEWLGENKDLAGATIRLIVRATNPDEYLLIMDSYIRKLDNTKEDERALGSLITDGAVMVSDLSTSQECIIALYGDRGSEKLCNLVYTRSGRNLSFGSLDWITKGDLKGRFTNLRGRCDED